MRFKTGFVVGCSVGYWAASKAAQLHRLGVTEAAVRAPRVGTIAGARAGAPRVVDSRAGAVSVDKMRAISDLARARLGDLVDSPIGGTARERLTALIGASLAGMSRTAASASGPSSR